LAAPDTALFVRAENRDEVWSLISRFPSLRELELERDVRPWAGDELAIALSADGGPVLIAEVADQAGAERYREGVDAPSEFAGDFLVVGAEPAPEGESLADTPAYARVADLERAPLELYAPAAGLRRALENMPAALRAAAGFAETPHFEGLTARVRPQSGGVRITARVLRRDGAPPAQEFAPALQGRAPSSAAAFLAMPGADALVTLLERGGAGDVLGGVRAVLPELAGIDLDRDVLGPLAAEAAVTLTARGATPVFTLTARSDNPPLTREALARLQEPLAEQLTGEPRGFRALDDNAFSLPVTRALEPSYALDGNVVIASTDASGLSQRALAQRGLAQELVLRAVADEAGGRVEALAFADLRQLLALGERTGLNLGPGFPAVRDDLRQVRAVGAVVRREESDSTAELFLEIP
jgi:hypothetical protein